MNISSGVSKISLSKENTIYIHPKLTDKKVDKVAPLGRNSIGSKEPIPKNIVGGGSKSIAFAKTEAKSSYNYSIDSKTKEIILKYTLEIIPQKINLLA